MASQVQILNLSFLTNASFAGATGKFVKLTGTVTNNTPVAAVCSAQTDFPIGVVTGDCVPTASGQAVTVMVAGVARVLAGGSITAGNYVGTDASGTAVAKAVTPTGADLGEWVVGTALTSGGAGEYVEVLLGVPNLKVQ